MECMVCGYRRTYDDGKDFPLHEATHVGLSLAFCGTVPVCSEHLDWVTEDFPETLRPITPEDGYPLNPAEGRIVTEGPHGDEGGAQVSQAPPGC